MEVRELQFLAASAGIVRLTVTIGTTAFNSEVEIPRPGRLKARTETEQKRGNRVF